MLFLNIVARFLFLGVCVQALKASHVIKLRDSSDIEDVVPFFRGLLELSSEITGYSFGSFKGFSGEFTSSMIQILARSPLVEEISENIAVYIAETQEDAPRHLARISSREPLTTDPFQYIYEEKGSGVNVYVIDTGVNSEHPEFEGRATSLQDFTDHQEGLGDLHGHGTHVAGIVGSRTYGVAKNVTLFDVKAMGSNGGGTLTSILAALDFTVNHIQQSGVPSVINLSLGAPRNSILNYAVNTAADSGAIVVTAAGNNNLNACGISPASAEKALTVGAIDDRTDSIASFSNWGECLDIFAPGVNVESVDRRYGNIHSNYKPFTVSNPVITDDLNLKLSGTSMASPIVAGILSTFLSEGLTNEEAVIKLAEVATKKAIPRSSLLLRPYTPNLLIFNGVE